jgi:hypothetical protein
MKVWDSEVYGPIVAALLADAPLNELGPGAPHSQVRPALDALRPESLGNGRPLIDRSMALACCAGIWLRHDYLEESHEISQNLDTLEGSYWHGILHRREPDFGNAHYWMRRVPRHATHASLLAGSRRLAVAVAPEPATAGLLQASAWSSAAFVDLCERALHGPESLGLLVRRMQSLEWELLFDHCHYAAFGGDQTITSPK